MRDNNGNHIAINQFCPPQLNREARLIDLLRRARPYVQDACDFFGGGPNAKILREIDEELRQDG